MKIIVLMKQVANKDAVLRIGRDEKWIEESFSFLFFKSLENQTRIRSAKAETIG